MPKGYKPATGAAAAPGARRRRGRREAARAVGVSGRRTPTSRTAPSPRDLLVQLAQQCVAAHDSVDAAVDALLADVAGQPDLEAAMLAPYRTGAARDLVRVVVRGARQDVWRRPAGPDQRVVALARINSTALLDFRLPGGQRLAFAGRDEIAAAAGFYLRQAADMGWKGRWLERIAAALPEGRTVAQAFSEAALAAMRSGGAMLNDHKNAGQLNDTHSRDAGGQRASAEAHPKGQSPAGTLSSLPAGDGGGRPAMQTPTFEPATRRPVPIPPARAGAKRSKILAQPKSSPTASPTP